MATMGAGTVTKNAKDRRKRRHATADQKPEAIIVIAGTITCTPAQLVNPMPSDTLRIGMPIMHPGFITMTGLLPSF